jgi:hypothetical protein
MAIDLIHTPLTFKGHTFTAKDKNPFCHMGKWQWGIDSDHTRFNEDDWPWNIPYFISSFMAGTFDCYPYLRVYDTYDDAVKDFHRAYRAAVCNMPERFNQPA